MTVIEDTIYLRIAQTSRGLKYDVSAKPNYQSISSNNKAFPTVQVKINLKFDDAIFAKIAREFDLQLENAEICSDMGISEVSDEIQNNDGGQTNENLR